MRCLCRRPRFAMAILANRSWMIWGWLIWCGQLWGTWLHGCTNIQCVIQCLWCKRFGPVKYCVCRQWGSRWLLLNNQSISTFESETWPRPHFKVVQKASGLVDCYISLNMQQQTGTFIILHRKRQLSQDRRSKHYLKHYFTSLTRFPIVEKSK